MKPHPEYSRISNNSGDISVHVYDQNGKSGHIKKLKTQQNHDNHHPEKKKPFIQPGTQCDSFQQILSTTTTTSEGLTTYFVAKALNGPALHFASQMCRKKQPPSKQQKKLPELPQSISGELGPHLYSYATITHEGLYRKTNQDKLTIYLQENYKWFSVYDGHGGSNCSQFLKEHLHQQFFKLDWKNDIPNALRNAFIKAQNMWKKKGDNSGSCALVVFIYQGMCYVANLGDSRAVLVSQNGHKCYQITKDHKPSNTNEQKRIIQAGGKIYQTTAYTEVNGEYDMIIGPLRVFPGRLSTTRTFGDFEAKDSKTSGNENVIICQPQITSFQIDEHDLIIMGSDGLWDRMQNIEAVQIIEQIKQRGFQGQQWFSRSTQMLLEEAMRRGSTDNISMIAIGLNDPDHEKVPKKGNQHIKIMGSLNGNALRKKQFKNKQNSYPQKMKDIDSRITEINKNASRLIQSRR